MKNPLKKKKQEPRRRVDHSSDMKVNKYISPRKRKKDQPKNKRKASKRKRAVVQLVTVVVVVVGLGYLLWSSSRVTEVVTPAGQDEYKEFIYDYISRNPVSDFKPFISQQGVEQALLDEYPEVESAAVVLSFFGSTMDVDVSERQAQLVLKTSEDKYYIVDGNGYAYANYDPNNPSENAVILTDDTEVNYDLADNRYLPSGLVEFVEGVDARLKLSQQFLGKTFSYRISDEARIVYVQPKGVKYEILMQQDRSPEEQVSTLLHAVDYYKAKKIDPSAYVDVRINGTVYYK